MISLIKKNFKKLIKKTKTDHFNDKNIIIKKKKIENNFSKIYVKNR